MVERGYDYWELYLTPVPRRNLILRLAVKKQEDEKRAADKARGASEAAPTNSKEPKVPGFVAKQSKR